MKTYNKPELNVEQFDVADVITVSADKSQGDMELSAGLEFDVNVAGDEF